MQIYANELKLPEIHLGGPRGLRTEVWSDSDNFHFAVPPPLDGPYGDCLEQKNTL